MSSAGIGTHRDRVSVTKLTEFSLKNMSTHRNRRVRVRIPLVLQYTPVVSFSLAPPSPAETVDVFVARLVTAIRCFFVELSSSLAQSRRTVERAYSENERESRGEEHRPATPVSNDDEARRRRTAGPRRWRARVNTGGYVTLKTRNLAATTVYIREGLLFWVAR